MFSTASAINATLFASARLARRIANDGELPQVTTRRTRGGVPVVFVLGTAAAMIIQSTADLGQITAFSSLVFLLVFVVVNASALPHGVFSGLGHAIPAIGALGCAAAVAALGLDLFRDEPATLITVAALAGAVLLPRIAFLFFRQPADHR